MKPTRNSAAILCGILGCLLGLTWVYFCCLLDPEAHQLVSPGWDFARQSLNLFILGGVGFAIGAVLPIRRRARAPILMACTILLILGGIGVLAGLGFVLMVCFAGWHEGELWGRNAMIGWLIAVLSAVYAIDAGQKGSLPFE